MVWNGRRELIHLTVTDPTGAPAPQSTLGKLREALEAARDPGQPICLAPADVRTFALQAGLLIDPAYERAAVEDAVHVALRAAFTFAARELAQPVTAAAVTSVMQGVAGVMAVDLDYLYLTDEPVALRSVLVAERAHYQKDAGGGCASTLPAHLLLIDPAGVTLKEIGP